MKIKTTVVQETILPIVSVTASCEANLLPVVLTEIVTCIEIADKFNGRLLETTKRPMIGVGEKIVATTQVIFKNEKDLSEFVREVKKRKN